jgi:hypothetical protein
MTDQKSPFCKKRFSIHTKLLKDLSGPFENEFVQVLCGTYTDKKSQASKFYKNPETFPESFDVSFDTDQDEPIMYFYLTGEETHFHTLNYTEECFLPFYMLFRTLYQPDDLDTDDGKEPC